jgi:uncharacterized protein (DUF427 family)
MSTRLILQPGPDHPITIKPYEGPISVRAGDHVNVATDRALLSRKASYPPVYCLPRGDGQMDLLARSTTTTWLPYKGEASHFSIPSLGDGGADAAWPYERPDAPAAMVADHLAFFPGRVSIVNEPP